MDFAAADFDAEIPQAARNCDNFPMRSTITADLLFTGEELIAEPLLEVEDGRIVALSSQLETELGPHPVHYEGLLAPAMVDVHIHGAEGHDVMEATPEALAAVGGYLATRGVGAYLATTVTAPMDATLRSLAGLAKCMDAASGARLLGIHLEGPFLSHVRRGVHPTEDLQLPSVVAFDKFWQAAEGRIRLMTIAPELAGAAELIAYAAKLGVRASLGHSNATCAEAEAGVRAGAVSATHTYNAMRSFDHRDPGILATVLTSDSLYAELICDGIHVAPEAVRLYWRAKGPERAILVTDAISATGKPDGSYQLGSFAVEVANGRCTANGVLAGSVLTLDTAVRNFCEFTGAASADVLKTVTRNPARMAGLDAGSIRVGGRADFAVFSLQGELKTTLLLS
jgi:N-acetylglucosamine-6-phosphate deacetylase